MCVAPWNHAASTSRLIRQSALPSCSVMASHGPPSWRCQRAPYGTTSSAHLSTCRPAVALRVSWHPVLQSVFRLLFPILIIYPIYSSGSCCFQFISENASFQFLLKPIAMLSLFVVTHCFGAKSQSFCLSVSCCSSFYTQKEIIIENHAWNRYFTDQRHWNGFFFDWLILHSSILIQNLEFSMALSPNKNSSAEQPFNLNSKFAHSSQFLLEKDN